MASDYKKIAEEHEGRFGWDAKPRRIYKQLYNDKTHFVYELIQNADDSESKRLKLQLDSNALLVWNDGHQFTEKDVRKICMLGSSDKDLTRIGTFGIGFKAVYNYTDFPEIYSGGENFRIRGYVKPESIDEMSPEIAELVSEDKTVFRLPFRDNPHQENDVQHLKDRLCYLSKERSLLFLRNLKSIEWRDERNAQKGSYSCYRWPYDKIQNVPENESVDFVKLIGTLNGNNKSSETFLVFSKTVHPPKDVIDKLLEQAEDEEEEQRLQQSADKPQPIEIAFKLQSDRITAMHDNCVLFAYLPTQKETHLKFLIQARYQTTPARDNILKPSENPWNRWLVQETANFLPEILEQLKAAGLLEPAFFNLIPLKGEVENEFKPIAEALQTVIQDRPLVPTQDGGYAEARSVRYPHNELLRELFVQSSQFFNKRSYPCQGYLRDGLCWLHPEIQDTKEFRRCYTVMHEAGVRKIEVGQVLNRLEEEDKSWFEAKSDKWLHTLYVYLSSQESELERIKKLPLVRLENGRHVCANSESVFFPPNETEMQEIALDFKELPILQSSLLIGDTRSRIEIFLKNLGVRTLHHEDLIREICSKYQFDKPSKPSIVQNRSHVRYLRHLLSKTSEAALGNLKEEISKTPILLGYEEDQPGRFSFPKFQIFAPYRSKGGGNSDS